MQVANYSLQLYCRYIARILWVAQENSPRTIVRYRDENGLEPSTDWFNELRDIRTQVRITRRIDRLEAGFKKRYLAKVTPALKTSMRLLRQWDIRSLCSGVLANSSSDFKHSAFHSTA